jgi:outer membrane usher protein FimD/PapC
LKEADMRSASLWLVVVFFVVFTWGCGTPGRDPKVTFTTNFSPPALTTLEPNTVPVNSSPFAMIVNGNNFGRDAIVFWNNVPQRTLFVSSTQLQVSITVEDLMQFGFAQVFVQTAGLTSNTVDFNVTAQ